MSGIPDAIVIAEQRESLRELAAENERLRDLLRAVQKADEGQEFMGSAWHEKAADAQPDPE